MTINSNIEDYSQNYLNSTFEIMQMEYKKSELHISLQKNISFNRKLLTEVLTKIGFKIMDSGSYFIKPFTHKQMYSMLNNMTKYMPELGSEIFVNVKLK